MTRKLVEVMTKPVSANTWSADWLEWPEPRIMLGAPVSIVLLDHRSHRGRDARIGATFGPPPETRWPKAKSSNG